MRKPVLAALALLCTMIAVPARAQAPASTSVEPITLPAELDRVLRDYERAWTASDERALAELFTDDGFVPTRAGWVRGHAAIQRAYENGGGPLRLQALGYAASDTVGYIVGTFGYGEGPANGKFVLALRRTAGGRWLIAADLDG